MPLNSGDTGTALKKGAIVVIKLTNFMIYRKIEFKSGPFLNLVLGPNGSGKSALVCAVILGFGGDPGLTGRSKDLSDYIRFGSKTGSIEIELYSGSPDTANFTIERHLKVMGRNNKKVVHDTWRLNNSDATKAQVIAFNKSLNIDINNLCQILPQERVVEFSRMTPKQLLISTEKSFGDDDMYEKHQRLIQLTTEVNLLEQQLKECQSYINTYTKFKTNMEPDLRLINERKKFQDEIEWLKKKLVWIVYEQKRVAFITAKEQRDKLAKEFKELKESFKPFQNQVKECSTFSDRMKLEISKQNDAIKKMNHELSRLYSGADQAFQEVDRIRTKVQSDLSQQKETKTKITNLTTMYEGYKADLDNDKLKENEQELVRMNETVNALKQEAQVINDEIEQFRSRLTTLTGEIGMVKRRLNYLGSKDNVKLQNLGKVNEIARKAYDWLEANRSKFQGNVYQPIITQVNIANNEHAAFIEQAITIKDLSTFLFENSNDLKKFTELLQQERGIRVNVAMVPSESVDSFQPNFDLQQYQAYGIYATVNDLFTAPPQVMAYLCKNHKLHLIPVGTDVTSNRIDELIRNSRFQKIYTPRNTFLINVSRYDKERSTRVRQTPKAKFMIATVDQHEIQAESQKLEKLHEESKKIQEEMRKSEDKMNAVQEKINQKNETKKAIVSEINVHKNLLTTISSTKRKIDGLKASLIEPDLIKQRTVTEVTSKRNKQFQMLNGFSKTLDNFLPCLKQQLLNHSKAKFLMARTCLFNNRMSTFGTEEKELEKNIKDIEEKLAEAKTLAKEARTKAIRESGFEFNNQTDESIKIKFSELPSTMEEIENTRDTLTLKANGINVDESVLGEYQKYKDKIEEKENECIQVQQQLEVNNKEMETIQGQWLGALQKLVERVDINYGNFMEKLGYSGRIYVHTADKNYEDYGIKIGVKFRSSEPMKDLDAYHQSGGERSVATMVYMLSLQELAKVPFRVVDEINQGMDERNERGVFDLIAEVSRQNSSQYFLFSPKLLDNLNYTNEMKIHVIFNAPSVKTNLHAAMRKLLV